MYSLWIPFFHPARRVFVDGALGGIVPDTNHRRTDVTVVYDGFLLTDNARICMYGMALEVWRNGPTKIKATGVCTN